ncbi:MAG: thioesterase [Lentisphaerae bacterium]|nr:thioesterase [Lentisphaerota bacterium]MCP4100845.1 thioesterase [Lentisphaerota bacterium]
MPELLSVNFRSEAFYDDILTIYVGIDEITKLSVRMYYKILNQHDKVVALAETGLVFIDYNTKKIVRVPEKFTAC